MQRKEIMSLRDKNIELLNKEVKELRVEISKSRLDLKIGKEKNLKKVSNLVRDLSQILTIIREKELMDSKSVIQ